MASPQLAFRTPEYTRINEARLAHFWSLGLPVVGRKVLELGAGVGDLTVELVRRGRCAVMCIDGRDANLNVLKGRRLPRVQTLLMDLDKIETFDAADMQQTFDIVFGYGILYHLRPGSPADVIKLSAAYAKDFAIFETVVGMNGALVSVAEEKDPDSPTQSLCGVSCRPTRQWMWQELQKSFKYVYVTRTQPKHEEFPTDWCKANPGLRNRAVFVGSHAKHILPSLSDTLLDEHVAW